MAKSSTYTQFQLLQVLESTGLNQVLEDMGAVGLLVPWDTGTGNLNVDGTVDIGAVASPFGDYYIRENAKIKIVRIGSPNTVIGEVSLTGGISWIKITKTYSEFSTAATTNTIDLYTLPAKGVLHNTFIKHSSQFQGGGITEYTVSVGITGNLQKYALKTDVFQSVGDQNYGQYVYGAIEDFGNTVTMKITAESVGANLNAATQGSVDIQLFLSGLTV